MGLLTEGSPLSWEETKQLAEHVRQHGIAQFINQYHKLKDRAKDVLRWGDEVEFMLMKLDAKKKKAKLLIGAEGILPSLMEAENHGNKDLVTAWRPEYAGYMIEGTPGKPYGHRMAHFNMVEANMRHRRQEILKLIRRQEGETALTLTAYPHLGCPDFTEPTTKPTPEVGASRSLFFPDDVIFQGHPRFRTLTRNIRQRRGEKVAINIPIYKDKNTPSPFREDLSNLGDDGEHGANALDDHIYMDAMGFGMGCSCLQMTFQACNINEARHLYDQLTPLCPIIMALSAASPIYRGYLADTDCRWNVIASSVDDRTKAERGLEKENRFLINKSRYDSIDSYLSPGGEKFNDINVIYDPRIYRKLRDADIDHLLAQHIAHLFIRDPISIFSEKIEQNDETDTDHFENIQSTNWQTMRFKPPPPNSPIGWRVEFRPTEVQLTDFENAAFAVFIVLVTRIILSFQLNLLIPISKVDENIKKAQKRDAVRNERFYFTKDLITEGSPPEAEECCACIQSCKPCEFTCLTVNEIINGKPNEFPGLIPLIHKYLDSLDDVDVDTGCTIGQYLELISKRASGELMTTARWMREFVMSHPAYQHDSVISDDINYDLLCQCEALTSGTISCPELLPEHKTKSQQNIPTAMQKDERFLNCKAENKANGPCSEDDM